MAPPLGHQSWQVLYKFNSHILCPSNLAKRKKIFGFKKTCHTNVHSSFIHYCQNSGKKSKCLFAGILINKIVVKLHSAILFSNKKQQTTNTCNNTPERHAEKKKLDTKEYILHDPIYMKF